MSQSQKMLLKMQSQQRIGLQDVKPQINKLTAESRQKSTDLYPRIQSMADLVVMAHSGKQSQMSRIRSEVQIGGAAR